MDGNNKSWARLLTSLLIFSFLLSSCGTKSDLMLKGDWLNEPDTIVELNWTDPKGINHNKVLTESADVNKIVTALEEISEYEKVTKTQEAKTGAILYSILIKSTRTIRYTVNTPLIAVIDVDKPNERSIWKISNEDGEKLIQIILSFDL